MRGLVLVLTLTVLLAGCVSLPGSTGPADDLLAPVAFTSQRLPGERDGGEPNVAVAPDGTVYVIAPPGLTSAPNFARGEFNLWKSDDAGATWTHLRAPAPKSEDYCSCDADVVVGPDGAVYVTDFFTQPVSGFVVERSMDGGRTWSAGNPVTVTNLAGNDRQWLLAGAQPGVVYLTYARGSAVTPPLAPVSPAGSTDPDTGLYFLRSQDAGQTFPQIVQAVPAPLDGSWFPLIGHPRLGADGTLYLPWTRFTDWNATATIMLSVSRDDGLSWKHVEIAQAPAGVGGLWPLEIDVDAQGAVHAAWMARAGEAGSVVWFSTSRDQGETWTRPRAASWPEGTAFLPWIAATGDGRLAIAYYGAPLRTYSLGAPAGTLWHAWVTLVDGERVFAPAQASGEPVKMDGFCTYGAACPVDRDLLDYLSVAFSPDGARVHVAYAVSRLDAPPGNGSASLARGERPEGAHHTAAYTHASFANAPW